MAFMEPYVTEKQEWAEIETNAGTWAVPFDVLSKSEADRARRGDFEPLLKYTEGNAVYLDQSSIKKGYGVRLSVPGYMDATDWEVYDSKKEALKRAKELVEEGEEGEDHATKKKSPAQLDREIKQVLSRNSKHDGGSAHRKTAHAAMKKGSMKKGEFFVVIEDASGQPRSSMTPEEFRLASDCPRNAFLEDCVKRWNKFQEQKGYEDRARIEIVGMRRLGATGRQHHSSMSDDEKIRTAIAKFPATFGLRGFPGDVFRISPTASYSGRLTLYTQRKVGNQWLDFAKGSESELRREVIS